MEENSAGGSVTPRCDHGLCPWVCVSMGFCVHGFLFVSLRRQSSQNSKTPLAWVRVVVESIDLWRMTWLPPATMRGR